MEFFLVILISRNNIFIFDISLKYSWNSSIQLPKWTSSKIVVKDFPYSLRVPSTDHFKSIALYKNLYFSRISFSLDHSSVSWDITLLYFFISNFICFGQSKATKEQIFRLMTARMTIYQIPYVIFQTTSQFSFEYRITLQCHDT